MLIDTDQIDRRQVAVALLKRGGMDFIDKPAEEVWAHADETRRQSMIEWREQLITDKVAELDTLLTALAEAMPA